MALKFGVAGVFILVVVTLVIGIWMHVSAAQECRELGGRYEEIDRRPVTRFIETETSRVPYTDWEPVYGCVMPR